MLSTWLTLPWPTFRHTPQQLAQAPSFSFTQIQIADVLKELQNLDPYKSAGLDNMAPSFQKLPAEIVAAPITGLFNLSFVSSEIPKDWKASTVIPLLKGGDTLDTNCYRPISYKPVSHNALVPTSCCSLLGANAEISSWLQSSVNYLWSHGCCKGHAVDMSSQIWFIPIMQHTLKGGDQRWSTSWSTWSARTRPILFLDQSVRIDRI